MCGIVGAIAQRNVVPLLLEGLKRLEYRGYDSAGLATFDGGRLRRVRVAGKVAGLEAPIEAAQLVGEIGIAHTRWATHGKPSRSNAHPHTARRRVAVVHNGIIENHEALRRELQAQGRVFTSDTDTEAIVHQVDRFLQAGADLLDAVRQTVATLEGAYSLGVIALDDPERLIAARRGSPLVVGVGIGEHFIASDTAALLPVTRSFLFLHDGDVADIRRDGASIYDEQGQPTTRPVRESTLSGDAVERGEFRHYMLKEIHEQPNAIAETLEGRIGGGRVLAGICGHRAEAVFAAVEQVRIIACGTSRHAGMVAHYWFEEFLGLPCAVETASEFRYRRAVIGDRTLTVALSQSGETADTLAALHKIRQQTHTLALCNGAESSLVRAAELTLLTHAGPEISVASTKAFTTQLTALALLLASIGRCAGRLDERREREIVAALATLPGRIERILAREAEIAALAAHLADKRHALFLGRGVMYPLALEGALKLKEVSYIHAEGYPAGELKHGPLALVDEEMPVIAVAPNDRLLGKLRSNLEEVRARGGTLYVFTDHAIDYGDHAFAIDEMAAGPVNPIIAPILFALPLQLLAYHVALLKGTDVDRPRNLAKSVTVE